ncbi:hypothetical protein AK830_g2374 [Neonectria ditissima]|uniref:Amidase domain-containing protein n=1 Tax=Neonectria ditissima TaxID=78410 RepID=A0A0P7BBI4_9HYPO|nr:hypothetical protein AK830_g2374 [Neonectria ditissima]
MEGPSTDLALVVNSVPYQLVNKDFRSRVLEPEISCQTDFLRLIVFYGADESAVDFRPSAVQLLKETWKADWEFAKSTNASVFDDGLYVGYQGRIFQPWRIYHDENLTMTVTYQPHEGRLIELDNTLAGASSLRIVVPPQSYSRSTATPDKPLKGVTIAVKDIFDIEGSKTTLCNRAWAEYHAPKTDTAPCVKRLQDLGAWVVGKTRLNAMVVREETMECVEWLAPYNPRGDGYQTSSGSSSGSCAALGAYPWVDFAIGSDRTASLGRPRVRARYEAINNLTGGAVAGIVSRVRDREGPFRVSQDGTQAGTLPYYKDAIQIVKEFYDGYTKEFGKTPFVHRALRWRWETADTVTPEERDEGWQRIYTYGKWLLDNIFTEGSILVLPIDEGRPNYRDTPPPAFGLLSGYSSLYVSPIAGTPEVTAPIGEILYDSEITHRKEPFPISVNVAAPPGTDLALIDLIHQTLDKGGKPIRLNTGRSIL